MDLIEQVIGANRLLSEYTVIYNDLRINQYLRQRIRLELWGTSVKAQDPSYVCFLLLFEERSLEIGI